MNPKIILATAFTLCLCNKALADTEHPSILQFCERFAQAAPAKLIKSQSAHYIEGSAKVHRAKFSSTMMRLTNIFQPNDSKFIATWNCRFSINMNGICAGKVDLPIAEHLDFAEYTSWKKLTIIEDNKITGEGGKTIGYAVPKYYKLTCK